MKVLLSCCVIWIVTVTVTAKPGFLKNYHHKHSKSRDLSNYPYETDYDNTENEPSNDQKYNGNDSNEADGSMWKSWGPTHEDYADEDNNQLYGEELQDDLQRPTVKHTPTPYDPCRNVFCHYGRVCRALADGGATCECADEAFCVGHSKRVCGDDGMWYSSHCELHRQACIKRHHIKIDHAAVACNEPESQQDDVLQEIPYDYVALYEDIEVDKRQKQDDSHQNDILKSTKSATPLLSKSQSDDIIPTPIESVKPVATDDDDTDNDDGDEGMICGEEEYARFKQNLLQYHCARVGEKNCFTNANSKQFVVNIMFNYYDRSANDLLDVDELEDVAERDSIAQLSLYCRLTDMMLYEDLDHDQNITMPEFYQGFEVSNVQLEERLRTFTTTVTSGNSIELKCDIRGSTNIVWKRNGGVLDNLPNDEIKIFKDGSLYIRQLGLHHLGNYSCQDRFNDDVVQTHVLKVRVPPKVQVWPSTQYHPPGSSLALKCLAEGVPEPELHWEKNEEPLAAEPRHYNLLYSNATLEINGGAATKDTGAYKCVARSAAGTSQDIATVFIENGHAPKYNEHSDEKFIVFHTAGFTVYDPHHCYMHHQVVGTFTHFAHLPEPSTIPTLCEHDQACVWGSVVTVNNELAYVTQPTLHRIVVISLVKGYNPIEIIETDNTPVKLSYVEHLDQVWAVCWNGPENNGISSVMVVKDASDTDSTHSAEYIEPESNNIAMGDLFVPQHNDLENKMNFGYVTRLEQQEIYKLDLQKMKYVKVIDLVKYNCVPRTITFVPLGGKVMVYCKAPLGETAKNSRLVLDYITDKVLDYIDLAGEPYVSPDGRRLVTVDRTSNTLAVFNVNDVGTLQHIFDEYTSFHMSDVTFYPSERERGYDLYASSSDRNDILYVNLASGKIEIIEGVGEPLESSEWPWGPHNRAVVTGGRFAQFLTSPSADAVVVIDGRRRHVQCEWQDVMRGNVVAWLPATHL